MLAPVPVRRVLITNCWLRARAGTELYVRDLSLALLGRGYEPTVFSPLLGEVADEIRAAGVLVTDDLTTLTDEPDVLHCHHQYESIAALSRFPDRPGLFVKHGAEAWQDETPVHPRLRRYVAVDQPCLDRILAAGVPAERTTIIPNGVDTARFLPRDPLPPRPRRAAGLQQLRQRGELPAGRPCGVRTDGHRDGRRRCGRGHSGVPARGAAARLRPRVRQGARGHRGDGRRLCRGRHRCARHGRDGDVRGPAGVAPPEPRPDADDQSRTTWTRSAPRSTATTRTTRRAAATTCAPTGRWTSWSTRWSPSTTRVYAGWDPADADHRAELAALAGPLSRLGPLRAELEKRAGPTVEQTPTTRCEAWQHEQEQARLLREHVEDLQAARPRSSEPAPRGSGHRVARRRVARAAMVGGPGARAGHPSRHPRAGCTWPSRSLDLGPGARRAQRGRVRRPQLRGALAPAAGRAHGGRAPGRREPGLLAPRRADRARRHAPHRTAT